MIKQQQILAEIDSLISEGNAIVDTGEWSFFKSEPIDYEKYKAWRVKVRNFLRSFPPPENIYIIECDKLESNVPPQAKACIETLSIIREEVERGYIPLSSHEASEIFDTVFSRFHKVARQLRTRYDDRPTLEIEDEHDAQNLLHALLQLYFDDVSKEEWIPSYGKSESRQDFLLKNEKVVIVVKKACLNMKDKDLDEQLVIDIEQYKDHPDCENIVCFVYDPEGRLGDPQGIMNDLNTKYQGFAEVIIKPD